MNIELPFLILLILMSGFFSGAEIALFSLSRARLHSLVEKKVKNAKTVEFLKSEPQKLLITILIGNNLVNIGASSLATLLAVQRLGSLGAGIATGVMTFLILFFGEIVPKSVGQRHNVKIALTIAPMMRAIMWALAPAVILLHILTGYAQRLLRVKDATMLVSEEDVKAMVSISHKEGQVEETEKDMIEKVFMLNDITAGDVMTPQEYIVGFDMSTTLEEAIHVIEESGYSRFPVYTNNEVDIEGILYLKDVFRLIADRDVLRYGQHHKDVLSTTVSDLIQPAVFVPTTIHIDDLMREFQKTRKHMAVVVDEHGSVQGIVTLEDLLEEIVGEIDDESDIDNKQIERVDAETTLIDPRVSIGKVNSYCNSALPGSRQKTISWLVLKRFGRIPDKGDEINIEGYNFIVEEADERRIKRLRMIRTAAARIREQQDDSEDEV